MLVHLLSTNASWSDLCGKTGMEWDALDVAPSFMAHWLYTPGLLGALASHWSSNEALATKSVSRNLKKKKIQFEHELYVFQGGRAAVPFPPAPGWLRAVWGVVQGGLRHRILLGVRRTSKHLFGKPVYFSSSSRDYDSESHFELAQRLHPEYFSLLPDKDDVFPHHFHDMMGGDYVRLWGIRQLTYSRKMSV